jgi:hypothetical protein
MLTKKLAPLAFTAYLASSFSWADMSMLAPNNPAPNPPTMQSWSQSQAMLVYALPNGRYHAEISYQDAQNNNKKFSFEGSKAEIKQQMQVAKGLDQAQKIALLSALDDQMNFSLGNLPGFKMQPFAGLNTPDLFDDAFFKQNPFNDKFFQDFMQDMPRFGFSPNLGIKPSPQTQQPIMPQRPTKSANSDAVYL